MRLAAIALVALLVGVGLATLVPGASASKTCISGTHVCYRICMSGIDCGFGKCLVVGPQWVCGDVFGPPGTIGEAIERFGP